jgi:hypothetical protein
MREQAEAHVALGSDLESAAGIAIRSVCRNTVLLQGAFRECGLLAECTEFPRDRYLIGDGPPLPPLRKPARLLNGCATLFGKRRRAASDAMALEDLARYSSRGRRRLEKYEIDMVMENLQSAEPRPLADVFADVEAQLRARKGAWT